ncbi:MAG: undecaprenyl/decaprenyl-phosphate alpha-N-acetylglucosaminyl 1-phosphate transferase, partial [Planctomycetes bacterium]|nr:undecaprenyl/decaprenyl-phosphate alpha-N-acetylglucosaminyl 1-phosphate transferase [Planctomycetota bacterium]
AEIIGAIIIYAWGVRIDTIANPFGNTIHLGLLSLPITVIWVVIITNAINLIDGIDGLAAGTCVLIAGTLFLLSSDVDSSQRLSYVILIGSLLGFLRYNFPPASIFMGDSGSLFLGFFLASASILSTQKTTAAATILIPIIAFGLPLTDMFYAVLRRYYRGLPFGTADRDHIHHKLIEKGLSRKKVVVFLYSLNVCIMAFLIVLFSQQRPIMDFVFLCILLFIACIGSYFLGYIKIIPFIQTSVRNFKIGKKRKYFNYVIRRFRRNALMSKNLDDFKSHISVVAQEYNFDTMEIYLDIPDVKSPFYLFSSNRKSASGKELNLSFPILNQGNYLGNVKICKELASGRFLCVSEMIDAISEEIVRFVTTNRDSKPE